MDILAAKLIREEYSYKIQDDDHFHGLIRHFSCSNTVDVINRRLHEALGTKNLSINDLMFSTSDALGATQCNCSGNVYFVILK